MILTFFRRFLFIGCTENLRCKWNILIAKLKSTSESIHIDVMLILGFPLPLNAPSQIPMLPRRTSPSSSLKFSLCAPTWIISTSLPVMNVDEHPGWHDDIDSTEWLTFFRLFPTVKMLHIFGMLSLQVASALSKMSPGKWSLKCSHLCTHSN
jgi:hypothetical protein